MFRCLSRFPAPLPAGGALSMAVTKVGHLPVVRLEGCDPVSACVWGHCVSEVKIASPSRRAIQGHRAASIRGQLPVKQSSSSGWKTLRHPWLQAFSLLFWYVFYGTQLLSPPACLWPSYPTLFLQPFYCPVIKVLLPLAFLECACKAYCLYDVSNVFLTFGEKDTLNTKQLLHSHWRRAHSDRDSFAAMVTPLPFSRAKARLRCTAYLSSRTKRPLMRRLQGGGSKRQVNPLCQTAGGACAAGRWPDECRHGENGKKSPWNDTGPAASASRCLFQATFEVMFQYGGEKVLASEMIFLEYLVQKLHFILCILTPCNSWFFMISLLLWFLNLACFWLPLSVLASDLLPSHSLL